MSVLKRAFCAAVTAIGVSTPVMAESPQTTLCDQLAAQARSISPSAWNSGSENALKPALAFAEQSRKPSETQLASIPWVNDIIHADGGAASVERLPDSHVYVASTDQGTLHCQVSAFLEARPGAQPNPIAEPMEWGEGDMCWTVSGDFGQVFGHPAFIAHGTLSDHTDDEDIRIVPWTGHGWGKMCKVALRFRKAFALTHTYCGDRDVCRAAGRIAVDVAAAYSKARAESETDLNFHFGPPAAKAALDAVQHATKALGADTSTPRISDLRRNSPRR